MFPVLFSLFSITNHNEIGNGSWEQRWSPKPVLEMVDSHAKLISKVS